MAAYKAWHTVGIACDTDNYYGLLNQPLLDNKFILDQINKPIRPTSGVSNIIKHLDMAPISLFFTEPDEPPRGEFNINDPQSWRMIPLEPNQLNNITGLSVPDSTWVQFFELIPNNIVDLVCRGPKSQHTGWAARELQVDYDSPPDFGDVYFIIPPTKSQPMRLAYFTNNDCVLQFDSFDSPDWGDWAKEILPNLRPLAVSCVSCHPIIIGWADTVLSNSSFIIPNQSANANSDLESLICPVYAYLNKGLPPPSSPKPNFGQLNKRLRNLNAKPLYALERWTPSIAEIDKHNIKINQGDLPPSAKCEINWRYRFQKIVNCPFVQPKYRQLIYWITTDTLCTGKQLVHYSPRGLCPHCQTTANWMHMFFTCSVSVQIWEIIDELGSLQWNDWRPLTPNEIPVLLNDYHPMNLLHLSTLWAMWAHWCRYFHDLEPTSNPGDWFHTIITKAKDEFRLRLYESHSAIQWLHLIAERRIQAKDKNPDAPPSATVPEKEFLLVFSHSIMTNPKGVSIEGVIPREISQWIGNKHLILLDSRDSDHPKLKFNNYPWDAYTRPPDTDLPQDYAPDPWLLRPRFCSYDY